mgnify:CR=1 FL=1|jgi:hypothetical protein
MKKHLSKLGLLLIVLFALSSCKSTVSFQNRNSMNLNEFRLTRADYQITQDASAEVTVKVILGFITKGIDKKNIKTSRIENVWLGSADEEMAVYQLLQAHPEWDYVTNVRFVKTFEKTLFAKTYKTKVIAKGIILKTGK